MFNLFKPNEEKSASRKSFNRLQQLLIHAEQYANEGHTDVAANLLRVLSMDATKMALSFDPPAKFDFEDDPDRYVAYLERNIDGIFEAGRQLRETVNERKKLLDIPQPTAPWPNYADNRIYREVSPVNPDVEFYQETIANPDGSSSISSGYRPKNSQAANPDIVGETAEKVARQIAVDLEFSAKIAAAKDRCRIESGECISDRGTDHCGRCVDHCEASDFRSNKGLTMMGGSGNE